MYIARLATNHLQGDATAARKSDRWVIPNPFATGDPTTMTSTLTPTVEWQTQSFPAPAAPAARVYDAVKV
jgi:hypothetical protein